MTADLLAAPAGPVGWHRISVVLLVPVSVKTYGGNQVQSPRLAPGRPRPAQMVSSSNDAGPPEAPGVAIDLISPGHRRSASQPVPPRHGCSQRCQPVLFPNQHSNQLVRSRWVFACTSVADAARLLVQHRAVDGFARTAGSGQTLDPRIGVEASVEAHQLPRLLLRSVSADSGRSRWPAGKTVRSRIRSLQRRIQDSVDERITHRDPRRRANGFIRDRA